MNTIENTNVQPQLIAITQLEKSPLNVRRTGGKVGLDELKASILAHGLMQNLVVTDAGNDVFHVIAGGRRLEAIRLLKAEGKLPEEFAVPCLVVTEEHSWEMSLAENTVRLAMHPADQFEAFAALIEKGDTAAEVARRFGIEETLVLKRMKLARVAPQLLKEYRSDGMTLECLMAYTITDDHGQQLKAYSSLRDWQKNDPSAIRSCLTEKMIDADSKLARFVGLDAYTAAGGTTLADLFGEEVYLENPALLQRLADEKLAGIRKELEAEGWGWIEISPDRAWASIHRCSQIDLQLIEAPAELVELKSRLDAELEATEQALTDTESDELLDRQEAIHNQLNEMEQRLNAFAGFDANQKKLAGCYVSIGQDGAPSLDKGLVKPEHRKQLAKLLGTGGNDEEPDLVKPKNPLSESLRRDLVSCRLQVAQVEIAKHPAIALDLLAFQAASQLLDARPTSDGPDLLLNRRQADLANQKPPTIAATALKAIEKSLPADWRKPKSQAARFEAFRSLPEAVKLKLLAYSVALTLRPKLAAAGEEATAYDAALALTEGNVAGYWRPCKDNFFARITRGQLLAIARDTLGETWAQSRVSDKKALLVDQLDRAFTDPAKFCQTAEQVEKVQCWLPAGMALGVAPKAEPVKATKARKAA